MGSAFIYYAPPRKDRGIFDRPSDAIPGMAKSENAALAKRCCFRMDTSKH